MGYDLNKRDPLFHLHTAVILTLFLLPQSCFGDELYTYILTRLSPKRDCSSSKRLKKLASGFRIQPPSVRVL